MFLLPLLQCTAPNVLGDSFSSESATCQVLSGIAFVIGLVSGFSTVDIFIVGKRRNKSSELTIFSSEWRMIISISVDKRSLCLEKREKETDS